MGWWRAGDDVELGDGPLDIAEEFLHRFAQEYRDDLGRPPRLAEFLRTLESVLELRAEDLFEEAASAGSVQLVAKVKRRPRKQPLRPGDVFSLPLEDGSFAFGRLTPQHAFAEFYAVRSNRRLPLASLRSAQVFRVPFLIDLEPLEDWKWKVMGHIPFKNERFVPQHFVLGSQVTCNENTDGEFLDVSGVLRPATMADVQQLPRMAIASEAHLLRELKEQLKNLPLEADSTATDLSD